MCYCSPRPCRGGRDLYSPISADDLLADVRRVLGAKWCDWKKEGCGYSDEAENAEQHPQMIHPGWPASSNVHVHLLTRTWQQGSRETPMSDSSRNQCKFPLHGLPRYMRNFSS